VRVTTKADRLRVFIYPHGEGDPSANAVRNGFRLTATGFESILGRVDGTVYVGRASAGGIGDRVDLDGDGEADVTFAAPCGFILQLSKGVVTSVETDRDVSAGIQGQTVDLKKHRPVDVPGVAARSSS
jgi:hypothetical protein